MSIDDRDRPAPRPDLSGDSADPLLREVAALFDPAPAPDVSPDPILKAGEIVLDRFLIESLAGRGGMGAVYRALDRLTGESVAFKVVVGRQDVDRFVREARILSELNHPAIVRYVAHGATAQGRPFLAMEWLEGEDLAQRLGRGGLSVAESLGLVRRVAEGLAVAHAHGVVHRDVKPSNVLLVGGEPGCAKLLDFGIVRLKMSGLAPTSRPLTGTGMVVGTVGYMSPEQATADRALDARTDVFALGCVLFECLTGSPAFSGEHVVAVLAKVLREEAPRVREYRPELPARLDEFVARMLSKDRALRPTDGSAVLRELDGLGSVDGGVPRVSARPAVGLSDGEQRLASVLLAILPEPSARVLDVVRRHGGDFARLVDGAFLVTVPARSTTGEQVMITAACALDLQQSFPGARIALATRRVRTTGVGSPGAVIDAAASVLAGFMTAGIQVDDITAGLLGDRFELQGQGGAGQRLIGLRADVDAPHMLLGKPSPCVGREKELGLLGATMRECIDESVARAVLVTGPPGQGKSRLRQELVAQARERGDVTVLMARADPVGAGSAFVLVRQLVRHAVSFREGELVADPSTKLRAHVADVCKGADVARIADFLGELIGAPSSEVASPQLRAARNDPQTMAEWLRRSFAEWLAACCAKPTLIVLEDLHWGDLPSVTYLGDALRTLAARPLMIVALARPEVHEAFPGLWAGAEVNELSLGRLTPRAAERLARMALGDGVEASVVARIVERADGNPFFLEELVRRVFEGGADTLPETVLSLVQSRLEGLEAGARRVARAASVFGEVFWRGGAGALLGDDAGDLDAWLLCLTEREVVVPSQGGTFRGAHEYTFRHGLLREAAYAMLTDEDRTTGHALAGRWLEDFGEKDALILVDHYERGDDPERALPWLLQAAEVALDGGNMDAAYALGQRGIDRGATGALRGGLKRVQAFTLGLRGEWARCVEVGREGMELTPAGTNDWALGAGGLFLAGMTLGDPNVTAPMLMVILDPAVEPQPSGPWGGVIYCVALGLVSMDQVELARGLVERSEAIESATPDLDPTFACFVRVARAHIQLHDGHLGQGLASLAEARLLAESTASAFGRASASNHSIQALVESGSREPTMQGGVDLRARVESVGLGSVIGWTTCFAAWGRVNSGHAAEAIASLTSLLDRRDSFLVPIARACLGYALVTTGDLDGALREAAAAREEGFMLPGLQSMSLGVMAAVDLRRGQASSAVVLAEQALAQARAQWPSIESILRLTRAEALHALGRTEEATVAIAEARDRILRLASTFGSDVEARRAYLSGFDATVRTLALAAEWSDASRGPG